MGRHVATHVHRIPVGTNGHDGGVAGPLLLVRIAALEVGLLGLLFAALAYALLSTKCDTNSS